MVWQAGWNDPELHVEADFLRDRVHSGPNSSIESTQEQKKRHTHMEISEFTYIPNQNAGFVDFKLSAFTIPWMLW